MKKITKKNLWDLCGFGGANKACVNPAPDHNISWMVHFRNLNFTHRFCGDPIVSREVDFPYIDLYDNIFRSMYNDCMYSGTIGSIKNNAKQYLFKKIFLETVTENLLYIKINKYK